MEENIDRKALTEDVRNAFRTLMGGYLDLAEGFFKHKVDQKTWNSFRKLVLDMGNSNHRFIEAKLEGRNYYHMYVVDNAKKDGKED